MHAVKLFSGTMILQVYFLDDHLGIKVIKEPMNIITEQRLSQGKKIVTHSIQGCQVNYSVDLL